MLFRSFSNSLFFPLFLPQHRFNTKCLPLFLPQHLCDTHRPIRTKTQKNPSHHYPLLTKIPAEQKPILKKKKKTQRHNRRKKKTHRTEPTEPSTEPHTHTQTLKPVGANNGHHTYHPSHRSANPSHRSTNPHRRFETKAIENTQKSLPEPPSELPMINPNDPPTDQQIHHLKPTDQPIQTHHQLIPAQRSKPSSPIHADPTSNLKNPKRNTGVMREKPCDER